MADRKKNVRKGHRASATRTMAKANDAIATTDPAPTVADLLKFKLSLEEKITTLTQLDGEIVETIDEADLDNEIEQADAFKDNVRLVIIKLDKAIDSLKAGPVAAAPAPAAHSTKVRLPKITMKKFNGDLTKWTVFWDCFESSVHQNTDLSDVDKFNYLNSLLEGSASGAISGLKLTAANYAEAIEILKKRFGRKQQIISAHMDTLLNLDAVTSQFNLKGLRHLYDVVENQVRSLKSLGVTSESYGALLSSSLVNKLPQELRLIVTRQLSDDDWDLDRMMKIVEGEIEARERASASGPAHSKKPPKDIPTATTLTSTSTTPRCCYCDQAHLSTSCKSVADPDERKRMLMRAGRCFVCLRKHHLSRDCRSTLKCNNCSGRHHVSICTKHQVSHPKNTQPAVNPNPVAPPSTAPTRSAVNYVHAKMPVLLQTAKACVYNLESPQFTRNIRILLDNGSQRSYVTEKVQKALSLTTDSVEAMLIKTFGSQQENKQTCGVVRMGMMLKSGGSLKLSFFTVPMICEPLSIQPISSAKEGHPHLTDLELADSSHGDEDLEIDMLIGSDHYWKLVSGEVIQGNSGPTAVQTKLGWVLSGPVGGMVSQHAVNLVSTHILRITTQVTPQKCDLNESLKKFWDLETLGIRDDEVSVYQEFEKNVVSRDGRYEVSLPWKEPHPMLPDNFDLSQRRLNGLLKRLRQSPQILKQYDSVIKDQLKKGIVETVDKPDVSDCRVVHYIPHHAVVREDKTTTKLRIVYDASARSDGPSLNDCLYAGPKFCQSILDIILRFRTPRIALAADIEKAFLMISISEQDRDALRFLWIDDIGKELPETIVMRFTRVVFGVSSSPFLLNATIKHHLEKYVDRYPEFVETFLRSIYVDDVSLGADSEDEVLRLYSRAKRILAEGGFNLRKFITNSSQVRDRIENCENGSTPLPEPVATATQEVKEEDTSYAKDTLGGHQGCQKILGIEWNFIDDQFVFDLSGIATQLKCLEPTKRHIIGVTAKFYDPLGFVSPAMVRFKMLFQELCTSRIDWDEPLSGGLLRQWNSLVSNFQGMSISIPRCYFHHSGEEPTFSLQGFCDASTGAYAAVVYIKNETQSGSTVTFVVAKTRVSPVGKQTIPRLELLSGLLLAKLVDAVTVALKPVITLSSVTCFTDSRVALCWIRGTEKEWKPFVQNRVNTIRSLVDADCWRHCPGRDNPADLPSRGITPLELSRSSLWYHGPSWLISPPLDEEEDVTSVPSEALEEMRKTKEVSHGLMAIDSSDHSLSAVMRCEDYSCLQRLLRVTARVQKFINLLKYRIERVNEQPTPELTAADVASAEALWVKEAQRLLVNEVKFDAWKRQFKLFLDDDGIFRCKGRLENAGVPYSARHPILLPKNHHLAVLVVRNAHERVMHNGVRETLTEIRTRYWLIRGRQFVRKLLFRCVLCRKSEGKSYRAPPSPPLPDFRVNPEPPFSCSGVDFAGPLYVKASSGSGSVKAWICLYTCCIVRAVHLEVVPDMSAEAFLRSFKRFTARRGFPRKMISDNAKSFKSAARIIRSVINHPDVQQYFAGLKMEWSFNVEKAPWTGGIFERMVRSTKRCLKKVIGKASLTYDELITVMAEVEMILNSRPLSYVSTEDIEEPLTPSHLLIGRRALSLPDTVSSQEEDEYDPSPESLTRRLKHLNQSINHFWRRWRAEYLLELRNCHRYGIGSSQGADPVKLGDIVLVHSEMQPRGLWRLGRVERLDTGTDGHVRSAIVRVHSRGTRSSTLRRPIRKLYPLEVNCPLSIETASQEHQDDIESEPETDAPRRRSQRVAASIARDQLKALTYAT